MHKINLLLFLLLFGASAVAQKATPQPEIKVRTLTLGISPTVVPLDEQQQIIHEVQVHEYEPKTVEEIAHRVQYGFQTLGFFEARAGAPVVKVVSETPQQEIIDVAFSVNPGDRFRLDTITFTGQKAFTAGQLRLQFPLADGDIFNTEKIRQGLDALRKVYENNGYINSTPVPNTEVNDATRTISLLIDIDEGVQYRIGALVLNGVETTPGAGAKLLESWRQYEGQIYRPAIPEQFLREHAALLPPGLTGNNNLVVTQDPHLHVLNFRLDLLNPADSNR